MNEILASIESAFRKIVREEINLALSSIQLSESKAADTAEFLTVIEVCNLLKISKPTLYQRMKDGSLKYSRLGGRLLFNKAELISSLKVGLASHKF